MSVIDDLVRSVMALEQRVGRLETQDSAPGFRSGAGTPVGSVTPKAIGDEYLDTTGPTWYKATGTGNTDWVALN